MSQDNTPFIFDATAENFDQVVIENSFHKPVLIDFWADWCTSCKALMPVLEKVAAFYQGGLLLVKINCDDEQEIVMRFGVRSLPTVVLFRNGQPVDGFVGNQPEAAIRKILEPHVKEPEAPVESPLETAQALFAQHRFSETEAILKPFLEQDNSDTVALILYARCLAEKGDLQEAATILDAVPDNADKQSLAAARAQIAFLKMAADLPEAAILKSRLAQNPYDSEATYQLAITQLSQQHYEAALQLLLDLFIQNRGYRNGLPHKTLLQVFDLLGNANPLVTQYRKQLYQMLY